MMLYLSAYSENKYTVYRSAVLKNNSLGTVEIIFINKLQLLFFHFSDLRSLVKRMYSMFPCYSLLDMIVIWLNMVSCLPSITVGWLNLKICQNLLVTKSILRFVAG